MRIACVFLVIISVLLCLVSCDKGGETRTVMLTNRDNVQNVKEKIQTFEPNGRYFGSMVTASIYDDILILVDMQSSDSLIFLYDLNNLGCLASTGIRGRGAGEIARIGSVVIDEYNHKFYIADHATYKMLSYDIDSLIRMKQEYEPDLKWKMIPSRFPNGFVVVSKDKAIAKMIEPIGNSDYGMSLSAMNLEDGNMLDFDDLHPEISKRRFSLAVSSSNKIIVEAFSSQNLLTIADLQGNIICDVVGKDASERKAYYTAVAITNNRIFAAFSGKNFRDYEAFLTSKIDVFDFDGNYIKTLDVGYNVRHLYYDNKRNRLFFIFEDTIQFGFLDLNDL